MPDYTDVLRIEVISSTIGNLFVYDTGNDVEIRASNLLVSVEELSKCRFQVMTPGISGMVIKTTYFTVGNGYDQSTRFSPKESELLAEGSCRALYASQFNPRDKIIVSIRDMTVESWKTQMLAMTIWVTMTHQCGSAGFIDRQKIRELLG